MKLAQVISGQLANIFRRNNEIEPEDLIKALENEVVRQKNSQNLVPNAYTIYLCAEDCHRLSAARMIRDLYEAVERKIIREKCFMDGNLSIKIEKSSDERLLTVKTAFISEIFPEDTIDLANNSLSQTLIREVSSENEVTIVADRTKILKTLKNSSRRRLDYNLAVITDFSTSEIVFGERQIYIGRKDSNDFVVNDAGASRIHAFINYERHRHVLRDAGSLNGTFVNKKAVRSCELNDGDKILIGKTTLTYKVL